MSTHSPSWVAFALPTPLHSLRALRPGTPGSGLAHADALLSEQETAALRAFAAARNLSLERLVETCWVVLLARHAREHEVQRQEDSGLPPHTLLISPSQELSSWLEQLEARTRTAPPAGPGALLQPDSVLLFTGPSAKANQGQPQPPTAALVLEVTAQGPLSLRVRCEAGQIDPEVPGRLVGHMAALLRALPSSAASRLWDLPLLSEQERHRWLVEWNDTAAALPGPVTLHGLFEAQAARQPEAVAVVSGDKRLSYGQLERLANQLAHHLRARGVGPEVPVAFCLERSEALILAMLGILKAGGAFLPLDPSLPRERLALMLEQSRARLVITHSSLAGVLPPLPPEATVWLDRDREALASEPPQPPGSGVLPESPAYLLYTSGSTGQPKGVLCPHASVTNLLLDAARRWPLPPRCAFSFWTNPSFDVAALEVFSALGEGGTLHVVEERLRADAEAFVEWLLARGIQAGYLPAFALSALLARAGRPEAGVLTRLYMGVEPIDERALRSLLRQLPGLRLINCYGPTETTIFSTSYVVPREGEGSEITPIGRPMSNQQVYLLDERMNPVPAGMPGELYIGGKGLARGYLGHPGLTAERFVPDPFSGGPGARLYRTGDLARMLPGGELEFLGRVDHQVKVRGFRIELGEIEFALRQHPAVQEAVAVVREHAPGDKRLVAYAVPQPGQNPSSAELRRFLGERLPAYAVPAACCVMESLPRTTTGKVDRRALPAPGRAAFAREGVQAPARSELEQTLVGLWQELLGLESVGVEDSFFEFGGNSLLVTRLASRLRELLGVELPLVEIFRSPTVAQLAARIEALRAAGATRELPPLRPVPRDMPLPLSLPQEQVWFFLQLDPNILAYNSQFTLRLQGRLDVPALERAFSEIVRRHESLRTTFTEQEGRPVQIIHPPQPVRLPVVELPGDSLEEREAAAERWLREELRRPFDVGRLPLVRWSLLRLRESDHFLVHVDHHFVHDGWSNAVLVRELKALYEAFSRGQPSPLPELPVQFADFAVWQRQWLSGEVLEEQLAHWKRRLQGHVPLELPTDRPRPARQSFKGALVRLDMPASFYATLRSFSEREGTTLFVTLMSAFCALLHRYTGQEDLLVGSGIANRRRREAEGLIGMIVNTVVMRNDVSGNPTFRELLRRVREVVLEALSYQDVPIQKVVEAVQPERDLSRNPLYPVMFSFHDSAVPDFSQPGLKAHLRERHNGSAKADLNIIIIPYAEQRVGQGGAVLDVALSIAWEYNTDLFDLSTMERMVGHYLRLLEGALARPEARLRQLPWLGPDERERLLREWNTTRTEYPGEACIHSLFERQARATPQAVALEQEGQTLTYRQLDERASQLAHHLLGLGVRPGARVALCLERGFDMVVACLAILKSGAAYVPLDPGHPPQRLALQVEDTGCALVLTHQKWSSLLPAAVRRVLMDGDQQAIARQPVTRPSVPVPPEALAYVIYTSGSTGRPKGMCIQHRNILRLVLGAQYVRFGPEQVFLQFAPLAFDASTFELWGSLLHGARLVLYPPHLPSLEELAAFLERHAISTLFLTTALFEQMAASHVEALTRVPQLLVGGEVTSPAAVRQVLSRGGRVLPVYGPTEATTFTTCGSLSRLEEVGYSVTLGVPLSNTTVYVVDSELQPVAVGVPGELCIGGDGLGWGYLNQPGLTAERFVPDPFSTAPGARLYRTGDRVRWRENGQLEFLGREDRQVKLRGFRIEPGEIEIVLGQHLGVDQAVVVVREDMPGDRRLVAYVVARPPGVTVEELRGFLEVRLPSYMVPSAFMLLPTLPLTRSGKVDRHALPAPEGSGLRAPEYLAPRTPVEEKLASLWAQLLRVPRIGVYDDFFALGGHSLLATQVCSRVRDMYGVHLPLRTLFESSTLGGFAEAVEQALARPRAQTEPLLRSASGLAPEELEKLSEAELDALLAATEGEGEERAN